MTNEANDDFIDQTIIELDRIASQADTPRNIQRACLVALEKIDLVRGFVSRSALRERQAALKVKRVASSGGGPQRASG